VRRSEQTALGQLDVAWWNVALGVDLAHQGVVRLGVGPRLSLSYVATGGGPRPGARLGDGSVPLVLLGARAHLGFALGAGLLLGVAVGAEHPLRGLILSAGSLPAVQLDSWLVSPTLGLAYEL
jgi:hypothetical protein